MATPMSVLAPTAGTRVSSSFPRRGGGGPPDDGGFSSELRRLPGALAFSSFCGGFAGGAATGAMGAGSGGVQGICAEALDVDIPIDSSHTPAAARRQTLRASIVGYLVACAGVERTMAAISSPSCPSSWLMAPTSAAVDPVAGVAHKWTDRVPAGI